jgi:hypothetical protein
VRKTYQGMEAQRGQSGDLSELPTIMDKEILLAFINGPGASLAFMWAVLLLFFFGVFAYAKTYRADDIRREAKEEAQRGALQNIEQTLRVMKHEQEQFRKQIGGGVVVDG